MIVVEPPHVVIYKYCTVAIMMLNYCKIQQNVNLGTLSVRLQVFLQALRDGRGKAETPRIQPPHRLGPSQTSQTIV